MTTFVARPPLQVLSMSSLQSGSRRQSARLQQKEDQPAPADVAITNGNHNEPTATAPTTRVQTSASNPKKRKKKYDEEDDGFVFSRVKKKKPRQSTTAAPDLPVEVEVAPPSAPLSRTKSVKEPHSTDVANTKKVQPVISQPPEPQDDASEVAPKKRQKRRMSFSTPAAKNAQPVRRSNRLSTDSRRDQSPTTKPPQELRPPKIRKEKAEKQKPTAQKQNVLDEEPQQLLPPPLPQPEDDSHSATKIALPFADTPVISRNKAMREGKSGKSERRSSMGLRGRRASSLIDSGTSNGKSNSVRSISVAGS